MNLIELKTKDLDELYKNDAYTIIGCGGNLNDWIEGYNNLLKKEEIGEVKQWYTFKGKNVNEKCNLDEDNAFNRDLTFLAFKLDNLNIGKLIMFKLRMHDRWFKDLIDNINK